jgi:hypothetical protein
MLPLQQVSARNKAILSTLLISLPLVFLLADYLHTPVLFNGCKKSNEQISLQDLLNRQHIRLGRYKGHLLHLSLDSLRDAESWGYLEDAPAGLIVSVDHDDPSRPVWGPLTRAVLAKLDAVSSTDASAFRDVISGSEPLPGDSLSLPLHIPEVALSAFPIKYLYVVAISAHGASDGADRKQQIDKLQHGLSKAVEQAGRDGIANLIVPNIGVNPSDPAFLRPTDLYPAVFAAASRLGGPRNLYFSIFHGWNPEYQRPAIKAVQDAWNEACRALQSDTYLVNEQIRLVVAMLFVCLLVCSRQVPINLKNWFIITASFIGSAFAVLAVTELFIKDWQPGSRCIVHGILLMVLAVLFPFLPRMNPQNIFDTKAGAL